MDPTSIGSNRALIRIPFQHAFLSLAMEFAEKGARGFGYADPECNALMLAVEELFSFYQQQASPGSAVEISLEDQGYRAVLVISFRAADPDLRPFNLTWRVRPDREESLKTLGPMIAARMVSSLRLEFADHEQVAIRMTRDRDYPPASAVQLPPNNLETPRLADPSREELLHLAALVDTAAGEPPPVFLARPGMAADMLAAGHLQALVAVSGQWLLGGVLWRPLSDANVELYGPYLSCDDPADALVTMLIEEVIARLSRTRFRGLLRRQGPLPGYQRFFDYLGEVAFPAGHERRNQVYYFRQLQEESGAAAYCQGGLATFLQSQYERLCLPRQIRETPADPRRSRGASVLTVEFATPRSAAMLRPLRPGSDMTSNLQAHLMLLGEQGIEQVLMEINAARVEETAFSQALEETGFLPRLLIPDAVAGDVVVYQWSSGIEPP